MRQVQFKSGDMLINRRSEAFYEVVKVSFRKKAYHLKKISGHSHRVLRTFSETHGHFDRVRG